MSYSAHPSRKSEYGCGFATELELGELFPECELGAMPPFGNLFHLPVLVDTGVAEQEFIPFNAGTHRDVIYMRFGDFRRLVDPAMGRFAFQPADTKLIGSMAVKIDIENARCG